MRRNFRDDAGVAPVNVGDELDVKIEGVGAKGDGIAKKDGFVLFVSNVKMGDEVKVRVTRVLRKVGFAEVVGKDAKKAEESEEGEESSESEEESEEPKEEGEQEETEEESENYEDTEDFGEDK